MKLILRTLMLLFVLSFATTAFAQTAGKPAKAEKAPKVAKASKKKANKVDAVAPIAPVASTAPAAATPAAAPTAPVAPTIAANPGMTMTAPAAPALAPGMVIDPITGEAVPEKLTTISFEEVTFDFGKIKQGDVVKHKFKFTNTGTNPLILENVKPSCGCTALEWPKEPIAPGKSGEIEAQFSSAGKSGPQMKNITLTLNSAERLERLTFTGEVIVPAVEGGAAPAPASPGH